MRQGKNIGVEKMTVRANNVQLMYSTAMGVTSFLGQQAGLGLMQQAQAAPSLQAAMSFQGQMANALGGMNQMADIGIPQGAVAPFLRGLFGAGFGRTTGLDNFQTVLLERAMKGGEKAAPFVQALDAFTGQTCADQAVPFS